MIACFKLSKVLYIVCGISVFVLVIFLLNKIIHYREKNTENIEKEELFEKTNSDNIKDNLYKIIKYEGTQLEINVLNNDTISNFISKPKLILRFSEYACGSCVDKVLNDINQLYLTINPSNILILTKFSNDREFKIFKNKHKESRVNIINEDNHFLIKSDLNSLHTPHLFVLDKNLKIDNFYIYQINNLDLNKIYFEKIKKIFIKT